jgi:hypothetical protein
MEGDRKMSMIGKRVQARVELPVMVHATVIDENDHGLVLDLDVGKATVLESAVGREVADSLSGRKHGDALYPIWIGRALIRDSIEELP